MRAIMSLLPLLALVAAQACSPPGASDARDAGRDDGVVDAGSIGGSEGEGEGEGEGECSAPSPDPSWSGGETVDYAQCAWGDVLSQPCADDGCVEGAEEAQLASVVRQIAADRGYGDKVELVDVTWDESQGVGVWSFSLLLSVDWLRCRLGGGADGAVTAPGYDDVEYMLPAANEVPTVVPEPAVVEQAMQACDPDARLRPCESRCDLLIGRPAGEDQCGEVRYHVGAARAGEVECPTGEGAPPAGCEIPDDWACDWRSYVSPLCTCQNGVSACPYYVAPSCWTCDPARFNDFECDEGCGTVDVGCGAYDAGPRPGAEGEGEGEGEGARACQPSPWEFLCQ